MPKAFSQEKKTEDYSRYCYDIVQDLINVGYSKEFKENKNIPLGYPGWSPNNIRRLIISPDGVIVQYHTTKDMKINNIITSKAFEPKKVIKCFSSKNYIPMLQALKSDRICSAIEEIILIKYSTQNEIQRNLPEAEYNLASLGIGNVSGIEGLRRRYARLYSISIINEFNIARFATLSEEMKSKTYIISEILEERFNLYVSKVFVNSENWSTSKPNLQPLGVDGKGYIADKSDGSLGVYFSKLINDIKEAQKTEIIRKFENRRAKKEELASEKELKTIVNALKLIETSMRAYRSFSDVAKIERIKSNLVCNLTQLDILWNELTNVYGFNRGYAQAMRVKANATADRNSVIKYIEMSKYNINKGDLSAINAYFKESNNTVADSGCVEIALSCMAVGLIEGLFSLFLEEFEKTKNNMPKYFRIVMKNMRKRVFYINDSYLSMCKFSEYVDEPRISVSGINSRMLAENLSLLFTLYCELYLIYGSGYKKLTSTEWTTKLLGGENR